ncbi:MAG: hypothetical protein JNJ76_15070 [Candidatus Competibacter sp.]|nr:hypothetical protein [Candidatus Competibacter sp.]
MKRALCLASMIFASLSANAASAEEVGTTTGGPLLVGLPRDCTYGPDTCIQGYVWRDAAPNDHVCVRPTVREQAQRENVQVGARRSPTSGNYGPNTCRSGYVWREAFAGDVVCVTPETRSQAARDNRRAASRKACR